MNLTDLLVAHTQRIHLLIIDPALEDYHHEHPVPTGNPGEYQCTFTPAKTSTYRVFADLVPAATGIQKYMFADLKGAPSGAWRSLPNTERKSSLDSEAGGLHFRLIPSAGEGLVVHA